MLMRDPEDRPDDDRIPSWNPTSESSSKPSLFLVFQQPGPVIRTGLTFATFSFVLTTPFVVPAYGYQGVKGALLFSLMMGLASVYYDWVIPLDFWRRVAIHPWRITQGLSLAGLTFVVALPVVSVNSALDGAILRSAILSLTTLFGFLTGMGARQSIALSLAGVVLVVTLRSASSVSAGAPGSLWQAAMPLLWMVVSLASWAFVDRLLDHWKGTKTDDRTENIGCLSVGVFLAFVVALVAKLFVGAPFLLMLLIGTAVAAVVAFALAAGRAIANAVGDSLLRQLEVLGESMLLLREQLPSISLYILVYAAICVWFAAFYRFLWDLNGRTGLSGMPLHPEFADFLYLAVVVLGTMGLPDIVPSAAWSRFAFVAEILVGVAWTAFVATALVRAAQRRPSNEMSRRSKKAKPHKRRRR